MGLIQTIRGWFNMILKRKAKDEFNVEAISTDKMDAFIKKCINIYKGQPEWLDEKDEIKTINFAKSICSEVARLSTLAIGIKIDGSARADYLQTQIDKMYFNIRHWVEYGCAYGTIILKPNGNNVDLFVPGDFIITDRDGDDITGVVFYFSQAVQEGKNKAWYTRLEYHRFAEDGAYLIDNVCYKGLSKDDTRDKVDISLTPWKDLLESATIGGLEKPLYGVLRTPQANNIEIDSPLSVPIFADALEELKDLDIAYSRNCTEINDSKRTVLMDSDKLFPFGASGMSEVARLDRGVASGLMKDKMGLPKYVRMVEGNGEKDFYQEINPTLNTQTRLDGINALLSQIAYKVGFSNGYFVFNESTGIQTATGVEAEQQRTIQFIKDVRDKLEDCMDNLIYAMDVFATLYGLAPAGTYEVTYDFGDITYDRESDRLRWWQYVQAGKVPAWMFFVKFEGMSEEEAKAMVDEAKPKEEMLFPE